MSIKKDYETCKKMINIYLKEFKQTNEYLNLVDGKNLNKA
jgi:hypothetical protein